MLWDPRLFEPLTRRRWTEGRARDGIAAIVRDADDSFRGLRLQWKPDAWDGWQGTSPMKNLYTGSAGVVWALDELRPFAETRLDLAAAALRLVELFRARPDWMKVVPLPSQPRSALLTGEAGILLTAFRLVRDARLADDLLALVRANVANEAEELMWGSPGTMVAARHMLDWPGDRRWRDAWDESAEALLARRDGDGLWTQRLYGQEYRAINTVHGAVGNVQALLPLLDRRRRERLAREAGAILARAAFVEDGLANWPFVVRPELAAPDGSIRLQWCCGAPGVVAGAAPYLDEELLLAGAEATWQAGPPGSEKGPGLCHGTAGQGFAFLKVFERTADDRWLDRARRFAVHALEQVERRGRGRHSLFTGDLGVALIAAACLDDTARFPLLG